MSLKTVVVVFSVVASVFGLKAESLVVGEGEVKTLSSSAAYDSIVVDGTLNIDSAANIQVATTVTVGSEVGKTGRLNVRGGATLQAADSAKNTSLFYFGKDGGSAVVTVDGATVRAYNVCLGYNAQNATTSSLTLTGGALVYANNCFMIEGFDGSLATTASSDVTSTVRLGEGSRIRAWMIDAQNNRGAKIEFAGGTLQLALVQRKNTGELVFEGVDGCPINFDVDPSQYAAYLFLFDNTPEGTIRLKGTGGFVKMGSGSLPMCRSNSSSHLFLEYTGGTQILGGGLFLRGPYQFPQGEPLTIAYGAALGLGGNPLNLSALHGFGTVTNDGASTDLELSVSAGVEETLCCQLQGHNVNLSKTGLGTLSLMTEKLNALSAREGKVKFLSPQLRGYPEYRFKVDLPFGSTYDGLHFSELTFYNGETVVTTPYAGVNPNDDFRRNLFDGDFTTKLWFNCNYQKQTDFTQAFADVRYDGPLLMTDYTWATAADTPPISTSCRDPGAWRLLGRGYGGEWKELSRVERGDYSLVTRKAETAKFPVRYGTMDVSLGTLDVAYGATLEVEKGVRLVLPDESETLVYGALVGDAFGLAGGSLKPVTGTDSPWRYYRVRLIRANRGQIEDNKMQFSEFALYDEGGNRVNLTENIDSTANPLLFNGELKDTGFWQANNQPGEFSFTLKEGAATKITGYLFGIDAQNNVRAAYSPSTWEIYAKENEPDEWKLIESQTDYPKYQVQDWTAYNGGKPIPFLRTKKPTAVLAAGAEVTVANGGVLDLTSSATAIGKIRLNADDAAGTIRGGSIVDAGTLYLDEFSGSRVTAGYELPIVFESVVDLGNLETWELFVNGKKSRRQLKVSGNKVSVLAPGTLIIFR